MRSPTSPVKALYARLCLSCSIQVEYSFCRMRLPATGFTLPWQLVAAQEPGPMYLAGSALSVEAERAGSRQKQKAAKTRAARLWLGWRRIPMDGIREKFYCFISSRRPRVNDY